MEEDFPAASPQKSVNGWLMSWGQNTSPPVQHGGGWLILWPYAAASDAANTSKSTIDYLQSRQNITEEEAALLTAMYGLQPASLVLAIESTSWPLMPKSHSFMLPFLSRRMFDGFMSARRVKTQSRWKKKKKQLARSNMQNLKSSNLCVLFSSFLLSG